MQFVKGVCFWTKVYSVEVNVAIARLRSWDIFASCGTLTETQKKLFKKTQKWQYLCDLCLFPRSVFEIASCMHNARKTQQVSSAAHLPHKRRKSVCKPDTSPTMFAHKERRKTPEGFPPKDTLKSESLRLFVWKLPGVLFSFCFQNYSERERRHRTRWFQQPVRCYRISVTTQQRNKKESHSLLGRRVSSSIWRRFNV